MILLVILGDCCVEASAFPSFPLRPLTNLNPPHPTLNWFPLLSPSHQAQTQPALRYHLQQIGNNSFYFIFFMFLFVLNFHELILIIAFTIVLIDFIGYY